MVNIAFHQARANMYPASSFQTCDAEDLAMIGKIALQVFLLPGNLVCNAIGARAEDDRSMIRSLINMLVWNLAIVLAIVLW
jgi:hypothetical protein